ncbi:hypothetical protein [Ectobacillus panaciterrae]|uniref:hypothetical protein n=1 Tax=Ectobacillus panaciterrae TaxID=363872 RepID=UPI00040A4C53|nr:hypothetical protein [Ectobacillus panaciterrae]
MRKLFVSLFCMLLLFGVVACQKQVTKKTQAPTSTVQENTPSYVAYEFLKASLQTDYEEEQKYLYQQGSYEIHKNQEKQSIIFTPKNVSGIKEYNDKIDKIIFVWIEYSNPHSSSGSTETEVYAVRKDEKGNYKVDIKAIFDFSTVKQQIQPKVINPESLGE